MKFLVIYSEEGQRFQKHCKEVEAKDGNAAIAKFNSDPETDVWGRKILDVKIIKEENGNEFKR